MNFKKSKQEKFTFAPLEGNKNELRTFQEDFKEEDKDDTTEKKLEEINHSNCEMYKNLLDFYEIQKFDEGLYSGVSMIENKYTKHCVNNDNEDTEKN